TKHFIDAARPTRLRFLKTPSFGKLPINLRRLRLLLQPEVGIRERTEFVALFALLLDPRVVLLVVPALPVKLRAFLRPLVERRFAEDVQPAFGFVLRHLAGGLVQAF